MRRQVNKHRRWESKKKRGQNLSDGESKVVQKQTERRGRGVDKPRRKRGRSRGEAGEMESRGARSV